MDQMNTEGFDKSDPTNSCTNNTKNYPSSS